MSLQDWSQNKQLVWNKSLPSGDEWLSRVCFVAHLTSVIFVRCATYLFLEEGFPGNPGTGHVT
jgi:hypothetical protein